MKEHTYIPKPTKIIDKYILSDSCIGLKLKIKGETSFSFRPGQFVMLSVFGFGEIPIGITSSPLDKGYFEVAVSSVGMVSQKIAVLNIGDEIGVNGPFGNGYPLAKLKGKDLVVIAGGIGIFPLRSLIRHIGYNKKMVKSLTILYGAKDPGSLLYQAEFKDWEKYATVHTIVDKPDKNWSGPVGIIPALYDRASIKRGAAMIVCGPPVMYKSVIKRFAAKSISEDDLYFMLERRMKCGIGKCQHCTCGKYYICLDGPVFPYSMLKYNDEAF